MKNTEKFLYWLKLLRNSPIGSCQEAYSAAKARRAESYRRPANGSYYIKFTFILQYIATLHKNSEFNLRMVSHLIYGRSRIALNCWSGKWTNIGHLTILSI